MEERYWVRHESLRGYVGPLTLAALRDAVVPGALPADADVRRAVPGAGAEVLDDSGWTKAYALLGLPAPPVAEPRRHVPPAGAPGVRTEGVLADLRGRSSYGGVRRVVTVLAWLAVVALVLTRLLTLSAAPRSGTVGVALFVELALSLTLVYVAHQLFQMLADIADCHVRRETDAAARRTEPRG